MTAFTAGTILGYPRIGRERELKRALESHWRGRIDDAEFASRASGLRLGDLQRLVSLGLDPADASIPLEAAHYDHVLDAILTVGAVPPRLAQLLPAGDFSLTDEWLLARGTGDELPLEMTKWLDSNYHYLVPELGPDQSFSLADRRIVARFSEALAAGIQTRPVIVGPATLLALAKGDGIDPLDLADRLVPAYGQLATALVAAGATWVQLDEPALVADIEGVDRARLVEIAAAGLDAVRAAGARVLLAAGYGTLGAALDELAPHADAIAIDLVRGEEPTAVPIGTEIVAGVVSGRNIWRTDLDAALEQLQRLQDAGASVSVGTTTSLLHVPHDVSVETSLEPRLASWLAFADQKVAEVAALAHALADGRAAESAAFDESAAAAADRRDAPGVVDAAVRARTSSLPADARTRAPYAERRPQQQERIDVPVLPTTTIGSFPQTDEIRRARKAHATGDLDDAGYAEAMRDEVRSVVELQEQLGIDVLVHGEPERNDMVQHFAELLDGFAATERGWVQSYGSRCTRPSILWGDVTRPGPLTVEWSAFAQSLTSKPVKGMLTGPVTILAWSFVRDDQPLADTAAQVALALRDEIADLERAGIAIVQVDEPALRELLPLEAARREAYLDWSVGAFVLATAGALPATQVHTHLCYSEFGTIVDAIDRLDADVTTIEAARSKMEVVDDLTAHGFARGIGPGVYDIHSPRVPSDDELDELIGTALNGLGERELWINPDCGLKTRGYDETKASLARMVDATKRARLRLAERVPVG